MCLILAANKVSKKYPLILAANRDEFRQRPTDPLHFWNEPSGLLAGKDLAAGGTWLGINHEGSFAALTNYRNPKLEKAAPPSRGQIIVNLLSTKNPLFESIKNNQNQLIKYNGFNLVFGDRHQFYWYSNINNQVKKIPPGIHGLSNKNLNTPWPKILTGKRALQKVIDTDIAIENLLEILTDRNIPPDNTLPDTGVGLDWERILSPLFIDSPEYGTRSSTVILFHASGRIEIHERTYFRSGNLADFSDCNFIVHPE